MIRKMVVTLLLQKSVKSSVKATISKSKLLCVAVLPAQSTRTDRMVIISGIIEGNCTKSGV